MNRREFMASMVAGAAMPVLAESGSADTGVKPPRFKLGGLSDIYTLRIVVNEKTSGGGNNLTF